MASIKWGTHSSDVLSISDEDIEQIKRDGKMSLTGLDIKYTPAYIYDHLKIEVGASLVGVRAKSIGFALTSENFNDKGYFNQEKLIHWILNIVKPALIQEEQT
jgi:hypothetical protein